MKKIYQPTGTRMCGQACIATIAEISLAGAVMIMGHKHSTRTSELVKALRFLGFNCDYKLRRITWKRLVPERAIIKIRFRGRSMGHWILKWDGKLFDPDKSMEPKGYYSSFLEIKE